MSFFPLFVYAGKICHVRLQVILHAGFPQQPPDVMVSGTSPDMIQRCESLIQQLEYNTYWSPKVNMFLTIPSDKRELILLSNYLMRTISNAV